MVEIPNDSIIRKKKHNKLKKWQGLKEKLESMWGVKAMVIGALRGCNPKAGRFKTSLSKRSYTGPSVSQASHREPKLEDLYEQMNKKRREISK